MDLERHGDRRVTRFEKQSVAMIAVGFAIAYALVGLFRHWHFDSSAFDLGIFDQAVWHLSRFELPASTISGYSNILGDHFYPILALFAVPYWIAPAPETLIVAQAVLLASSIVPVFLFARRRLPVRPALGMCLAYGLFWGMQRTAMFDVHEMAFAPVLIATAILAIDCLSWRVLWMASAALMLVKEDLIPLVGAFGVLLIFSGARRQGLLLIMVSLSTFLAVVTVVIPSFSDTGAWNTGSAYHDLWRRPWTAPAILLDAAPAKLHTVVFWLAPFGFLPLCSPLGWLLTPLAAERLLSSAPSHWSAGGHYSAPLAPILAMSASDGLARLSRRVTSAKARNRLIVAFIGASVLVSAFVPGHQPLWRIFVADHYRERSLQQVSRRALSTIPAGASVVAQAAVVPHLSERAQIYVLKPFAPEADYVIGAADLSSWPVSTNVEIASLLEERKRRGYHTVFDESGWVVLARSSEKHKP